MKRIIHLSLLLLFSFSFGATNLIAQGLLLDDEAYNQLTRLPGYGDKAGDELLRNTPKVDLRPFCPRPQHQGAIGSCTGWSTGYGAMTIMQAMQRGWKGQTDTITKYAMSALYLYNQVKIGSCEGGAYISKAVAMAKAEGSILSSTFDQFKNDCTSLPTERDSLEAIPNRIKDFMTLFGTKEAAAVKLEKVRLSLAQEKPVVIGMLLRKNFQYCKAAHPYWTPELGDTTFMGAHAMVVIGYDDGKQAFEILNSWGDQWGNGGFIWVKYADFAKYCTYAIQLVPGTPLGENETLIGANFTASTPVYTLDNSLGFRSENFLRRGGYYELAGRSKAAGALLRWQLPRITPGSYLYAFSMGPKRKITVHWPRDGTLDDKYAGTNESAIITLGEPGLYLPDEYGALRFSETGTEYICFLVSRTPITDVNAVLGRLRAERSADFIDRLRAALDGRLAASERVNFAENELAFSGRVGEEDIIGLVVRVEIK
jgi:hypothetical protein